MFQNLRTNSIIYILHKDDTPRIETGTVLNVSAPVPKFPIPPNYSLVQEMVVDVLAKVGDSEINYQKLPANQEVADFGNSGKIIVSCSRDAMNAEVSAMKQKSISIIKSIDFHKKVIANCENILHELNPEFAEKQKQQREIEDLRTKMDEITKNMSDLMTVNRQLLTKLNRTSDENVAN